MSKTKTKKQDGRKSNRGIIGKAGRKPIEDKKIPVTVYVPQSVISDLGGIENAREISLKALQ
jgi:hypothetical protein